MFDFNSLLPQEEEQKAADYARGYSVASVASLNIEGLIRQAWPNESDSFYQGVIIGLRDEL